MATELEQAIQHLNKALENAPESEKTLFFEQNFQNDSDVKIQKPSQAGKRSILSMLKSVLSLIGLAIMKIFLWLLMAPFFLLTLVKNWFLLVLFFLIAWNIILIFYRHFSGVEWIPGQSTVDLSSKTVEIVVYLSAAISLIATYLEYSGKID